MPQGEITRLLGEVREGSSRAENELLTILYPDLHEIASRLMRRENSGHTLQTTALLHEAYFRLAGQKPGGWKDRAHFLGFAAHVMRHILIDHAREKRSQRRGGSVRKISLESIDVFAEESFEDLLVINEALTFLSQEDSRAARVLEAHVFGGLNISEISSYVGISERTVKRDLSFAKAWVYRNLYSVPE